jgi:hypothetical protein
MSYERRIVCAASHCLEPVERGMLMCRPHWFALPVKMRSAIGHSYRARQMVVYQEALRQAVDFIDTQSGAFTGVFENPVRRWTSLPLGTAAGSADGVCATSPSAKPVVRRPRLTVRRLKAIEMALLLHAGIVRLHKSDKRVTNDAIAWVRGELAKRQARKAVSA